MDHQLGRDQERNDHQEPDMDLDILEEGRCYPAPQMPLQGRERQQGYLRGERDEGDPLARQQ
jgi:hypothetical protein